MGNLAVATGITVGPAFVNPLQFFPLSYVLAPQRCHAAVHRGRTGRWQHGQRCLDGGGRALYFVDNPAQGTINGDGLFTSAAPGKTYVTTVFAGHSSVAPLSIQAPEVGATTVGAAGALLTQSGLTIGVGPGTVPDGTTVQVTAATAADLP